MWKIIDQAGNDQCGLMTDLDLAKSTCDQMNKVSVKREQVFTSSGEPARDAAGREVFRTVQTNEFHVIALPLAHGPRYDAARAQAVAKAAAVQPAPLNYN